MSFFVVNKTFKLHINKNHAKDFERGGIYPYSALKGAEHKGIGNTIRSVLFFLEGNGYIRGVPIDIHELLKIMLRLK